jgi:two-component system, sensor histidine kinase RpfC
LAAEAAPLFVGFYIFTILGFGFRVGTQAMYIGQASSILGFVAAIAVSDFWRSNLTMSASVLILLIAVPIYTTIRILYEDA